MPPADGIFILSTSGHFILIIREQKVCEVCKAYGRLRAGNEVHHIVKVANGNNDTHYDLDNLIYVCTKCHRVIEGMNVNYILNYIEE